MKTIDFSYFIERYIANEMGDSEKRWFEKELEGNEKLRKELDLRKNADEILKNRDIISLRNKLLAIEKQRSEKTYQKKRNAGVYLKSVSAVGIAVIIGLIFIMPGKKLSSNEIISRYYKTYDPPTTQRSAKITTSDYFNQALEYYKTRDFENAAIYFRKVIMQEPKDMFSTLLFGISKFEDKEYPEAQQSFGKVINDKNNLYIDQAEWYLALCYIKTGEKDKAVPILEKIKNENGVYKDDAKDIIKRLK